MLLMLAVQSLPQKVPPMSTAFAVVLSLAAAAAPASSAYKFQGVLTARQPAEDEQPKKFEMTVVPRITGDDQSFFWMLEERGRGSLAWPDHIGNFTLDPMGRIGETPPLSMLLERPDRKSTRLNSSH